MTHSFRDLCAKVIAFNEGSGEYNFSHLSQYDRDNAAFDAWQEIRAELKGALAQSQPRTDQLTFPDAIRLSKGCHDYGGGYSDAACAEAFHAGIDTVVNVLTKAATGPWDYQTKAVFQAAEPPANGEVGELVEWLRLAAGDENSYSCIRLTSAANMLEQLAQDHVQGATKMVEPTDGELSRLWSVAPCITEAHGGVAFARTVLARWNRPAPQPVPVSERLPEAEDCDAKGRCWGFHPYNSEDYNVWHSWSLVPSRLLPSSPSWIGWDYWLPYGDLPLPSGEVE